MIELLRAIIVKVKRALRHQCFVLSLIVVIAILSFYPETIYKIPYPAAGHFIAYAFLTIILNKSNSNVRPWFIACGVFAFSACIELLQNLTPTRQSSLEDLAWNLAGVLVATTLWIMFQIRKRHFSES